MTRERNGIFSVHEFFRPSACDRILSRNFISGIVYFPLCTIFFLLPSFVPIIRLYILKAHSRSHSKSGGSISASLECQCCFWIADRRVSSHIARWAFRIQALVFRAPPFSPLFRWSDLNLLISLVLIEVNIMATTPLPVSSHYQWNEIYVIYCPMCLTLLNVLS